MCARMNPVQIHPPLTTHDLVLSANLCELSYTVPSQHVIRQFLPPVRFNANLSSFIQVEDITNIVHFVEERQVDGLPVSTMFIAIRGTYNENDWLSNFCALRVEAGMMERMHELGISPDPNVSGVFLGCEHAGFVCRTHFVYEIVRLQIEAFCGYQAYQNHVKRIVFTGHSLGGIVARLMKRLYGHLQLNAAEPNYLQGIHLACITFASPDVFLITRADDYFLLEEDDINRLTIFGSVDRIRGSFDISLHSLYDIGMMGLHLFACLNDVQIPFPPSFLPQFRGSHAMAEFRDWICNTFRLLGRIQIQLAVEIRRATDGVVEVYSRLCRAPVAALRRLFPDIRPHAILFHLSKVISYVMRLGERLREFLTRNRTYIIISAAVIAVLIGWYYFRRVPIGIPARNRRRGPPEDLEGAPPAVVRRVDPGLHGRNPPQP
eukprot:ANDGO_01902.mRNA.1 hypothetical protein